MVRRMLVQRLGGMVCMYQLLSSLVMKLAAGKEFGRGVELQTTGGDAVLQVCRSNPRNIASPPPSSTGSPLADSY